MYLFMGVICESEWIRWKCDNELMQGGEKELRVGEKPKNCLMNEKKGKKKISWQDPVALKV